MIHPLVTVVSGRCYNAGGKKTHYGLYTQLLRCQAKIIKGRGNRVTRQRPDVAHIVRINWSESIVTMENRIKDPGYRWVPLTRPQRNAAQKAAQKHTY